MSNQNYKDTKKLHKIFTPEITDFLKTNKDQITYELLQNMRQFGNPGKRLALEILDIYKDEENYYKDAFNNRISQNGNRMLKKPFTKLPLYPIHLEEIERCQDIHYFTENYVKIVTPKGINFPDLRSYQTDFLNVVCPQENESIIGLLPRQSGKSVTVAIYLSHSYIYLKDMNIGIAANKAGMAREFLDKTKNILINLPIWFQPGTKVWNKTFIEAENGMRIITDATSGNSFRGFTCNIVVVDECAFIRPTLWEEFSDSIFPSQSSLAFKKTILISTANGLNHYYHIINGARKNINGFINYEVDWREVPRYRSDGTVKDSDEFRDEIIAKFGIVYFNQNYGGDFIGSSHTLISVDKLKQLVYKEPELILDNKLKIYHKPIKGHQYIMTVDAAKDGIDAFVVQIVDITNFQFKQAATAKLQIDYLLMPEFINEWCSYYYNPYLIIENNEGAGQSIADQMYLTYEYENIHFDKKVNSNSTNLTKNTKKYPGTRTTVKTRKQILQTMKTFIENNNLEINNEDTIKEFFTFILINEKYQADEGTHDDCIMSLALVFTLFNDTKNFEDMREVTKLLCTEIEEREEVDMSTIITVGGFDDGVEENETFLEKKTYEEYLHNYEEFN